MSVQNLEILDSKSNLDTVKIVEDNITAVKFS